MNSADTRLSFDLESYAKTITPSEDLLQGNNDAPIIKLINGILSQAIKAKASDIHFEPFEDAFIVRLRIDGVMRELISQDSRLSPPIVSRLKIMSKLDIAERRKPQDGRVSLSLGPQSIDVRVSTLPSSYGERVVLRLLDKDSAEIDLNYLGFSDYVNSKYLIEEVPTTLDFVYSRNFDVDDLENTLKLSLEIRNILDESYEATVADNIFYDQYDLGRSFSLGLKYQF